MTSISSRRSRLNFLLLLICFSTLFSYSLQDICEVIDCGEGHCVPDGLLFDCVCNPGWKTFQIAPMPFGVCIIPNCTLDFSCGGGAPSPPTPPPLPITGPCAFVWCGFEGECVVNGTEHYCQCNDRAQNLFNNPLFICIEQCYLGGDCAQLGLSPLTPPPSTSTGSPPATGGPRPRPPPPPPPTSIGSPPTNGGPNGAPYPMKNAPTIVLAVLASVFLLKM